MRFVGYFWASPVSVLGLVLALFGATTGGRLQIRGGVIEAWGGCTRVLLRGRSLNHGGAAMTLGHVILARDAECLARSREHERFHVRQFARWGPLLIPAYWIVSIWLRCRGYDLYLDHPFEPPPTIQ